VDDFLGYRLAPELALAQIQRRRSRLRIMYRDINLLLTSYEFDPLAYFDIAAQF